MAASAEIAPLEWTMGFRNRATGKYLTQEAFEFSLNAASSSLKKKQIFSLLPAEGGVYIKTHLGRYLYALPDGKWKGDLEAPNANAVWTIEPRPDGTWALKTAHGYYANFSNKGGDGLLSAYVKELPTDMSGEWVVHLAMHPQINLLNVMRKRYVSLKGNELQANEDIPWGEDALLTFVFFEEHPSGRYGFMAANGQFLSAGGKLVPSPTKDAQFLLGFHDDCISLRDEQGNYLSCIGATGTLKTGKSKVTRDELFQISDSEPQFVMTASSGKKVSIRSSVEVKADQADVAHSEQFQLEVDPAGSGKVAFKTAKTTYWSVTGDGTIAATGKAKGPTELFTVEYFGTRVKFIASNGKHITVRSNGGLLANGNGSDPTSLFTLVLINRPELVLRGQYGFLGVKGASGRLEVAKSHPDTFTLTCVDGAYNLQYEGKYWTVDRDGVAVTSATPVNFFFEFVERSKFLIKHADSGKYLQGEQAGGFRATGTDSNLNTLWEY